MKQNKIITVKEKKLIGVPFWNFKKSQYCLAGSSTPGRVMAVLRRSGALDEKAVIAERFSTFSSASLNTHHFALVQSNSASGVVPCPSGRGPKHKIFSYPYLFDLPAGTAGSIAPDSSSSLSLLLWGLYDILLQPANDVNACSEKIILLKKNCT